MRSAPAVLRVPEMVPCQQTVCYVQVDRYRGLSVCVCVCVCVTCRSEVHTAEKGPVAGDDDGLDARVGRRRGQRAEKLGDKLPGQRVALAGPVQGEEPDAIDG